MYFFSRACFEVFFLLLLSFFLFCGVTFSKETSHPPTDYDELSAYWNHLIQKGFTQREQITSGQMVITNHLTKISKNGDKSSVDRKITIAFDEKRRRVDRHNVFSPQNSFDDVGCVGCYKKDNRLLLHYSNYYAKREGKENDVITRTAMTIYDEKQLAENVLTKFWTDDFGFIPQYIGFFCHSRFPTNETVEEGKNYLLETVVDLGFLGEQDASIRWSGIDENSSPIVELVAPNFSITIVQEDHKGIPCKKIIVDSRFDEDSSVLKTLWIAEGQGGALRKHHIQCRGIVNYEELLEVDVALDEGSNIWFPSAWQYWRKNNGKPYISQNVTVSNVILNKPIPENLFDLKDIKILPAGVSVRWPANIVSQPHEGNLIWDGNDIVSQNIYTANSVYREGNNNKDRFSIFFLVNIVFLGMVLSLILWRYYQCFKRQS